MKYESRESCHHSLKPSVTSSRLSRDNYCSATTPGHERRRVHNGLINKYPTIIARCSGTADIVDALALARTLRLEVAVRGGGHNVAGRATIDSGLLVDLSPMRGVHVDVHARTARAEGGSCGRSSTARRRCTAWRRRAGSWAGIGIAGLTLGGGVGWLMPKYGLALDNLRSADVVTADGRVVHASADENAGLFLGYSRRRRQLRHRGLP